MQKIVKFVFLSLSIFFLMNTAFAGPQLPTLLFLPDSKIQSNNFFKKNPQHQLKTRAPTSSDLLNYFQSHQELEVDIMAERMSSLVSDLLINTDKYTEEFKRKQLEEIFKIFEKSQQKKWFGPFQTIKNFASGVFSSRKEDLTLLFDESEEMSSDFPKKIRENIKIEIAEKLANALKTYRNSVKAKVTLNTNLQQKNYCILRLDGVIIKNTTLDVTTNKSHKAEEFCVNGQFRSTDFVLKPFQKNASIDFYFTSTLSLQKPSHIIWRKYWNNTPSIIVVNKFENNKYLVSIEKQNTLEKYELTTNDYNKENSAASASTIPSYELYPQIWFVNGSLNKLRSRYFPDGNLASVGASYRASDFALSLDVSQTSGSSTKYWMFNRIHWAHDYSLLTLSPLVLRPVLGIGVLAKAKNFKHFEPINAESIFASLGYQVIYAKSSKLYFAVGQELDISFAKPKTRLFGFSVRGGFSF